MRKRLPLLVMVEWLGANEVRLFFNSGRVVETKLPIKNAKKAHIVDHGMGLDPGDGMEWSAPSLAERGKVLREGYARFLR